MYRKATIIVTGLTALTLTLAGISNAQELSATTRSTFDPVTRAARHPIIFNRPAVDFFEGALIGNGGLGAVVTTRPDAVVIRFGHNDVWDIRHDAPSAARVGTFADVFERVSAIPASADSLAADPWYRDYRASILDDTRYPRPLPCGSVILRFDPRDAELIGHYVHINSGFCEVDFLMGGELAHLQVFAGMSTDRLWLRMVDEAGEPILAPFLDITIVPDPDTPAELPSITTVHRASLGMIGFRQALPQSESLTEGYYIPGEGDKAFALKLWVNGGFLPASDEDADPLNGEIDPGMDFVCCIQLDSGTAREVGLGTIDMPAATTRGFTAAATETVGAWETYWRQSGVALDDEVLERTWYQNMYFLRCALRPGVTSPGIFANWRYRGIGTGPGSGYQLDYHTQQTFWAAFSANHPELHLPYVDLVENSLLPLGRAWANDYYGLDGAFFPIDAYPVPMTVVPDPLPEHGWEIAGTPWTVQSLWWHFMYTMDLDFLRDRAMTPIREAARFLAEYMSRTGARTGDLDDGDYHIFPSSPPGRDGIVPGLVMNADPLPDLTLTKFIFFAYLEACRILDSTDSEGDLPDRVRTILEHFPGYATADTAWGDVFVSVAGEDPETLYDVPVNLMTVFPGEEHGLHSGEDIYRRAARTYLNQRNAGTSDLVMLNMIGARLGMLDLDRFVRQIEYCRLPNGACTLKTLQIGGEAVAGAAFDRLGGDGIWIETFALPAVIDECLLQSYSGMLRLFPNWPDDTTAEFRTLRAAGAFLVSARIEDGTVRWVEVTSEAGAPLRVISPWDNGATVVLGDERTVSRGPLLDLAIPAGNTLTLLPPS